MVSPYAGYTDSTEVVANYIFTALKAAATQFGINDTNGVYYGDQTLLPSTPSLCVIPGPEKAMPNGVGGRPMLMNFNTFVMVYFSQIRDIQQNTHASLKLANEIKRFMNADPTLGGIAFDSYCSDVEPGVAAKGGALIDAARMTFFTRSKITLNA